MNDIGLMNQISTKSTWKVESIEFILTNFYLFNNF